MYRRDPFFRSLGNQTNQTAPAAVAAPSTASTLPRMVSSLSAYPVRWSVPVQDASAVTTATVAAMVECVRWATTEPSVIKFVSAIKSQIRTQRDSEKLLAAWRAIRARCQFVRDEVQIDQSQGGAELLQSPEVFLETRKGDCDDFSMLSATVLRLLGYKRLWFETVGTDKDNPGAYTHVAVKVLTADMGLVTFDPSYGAYLGWKVPEHERTIQKDWVIA